MTDPAHDFKSSAQQFGTWMREQSWPLWWTKGRLGNGSFVEALNFDGEAVNSDESRVRVQARQLFCFSLAWKLGWRDGITREALELSVERFARCCLRPDGIAGMRIDVESGQLVDDSVDLYDNAFALLASAQAHAALDSELSRSRLLQLFEAIRSQLQRSDSGGYCEQLPVAETRLQNPHMHLFESMLLAYEASESGDIASAVGDLYDFVRATFFDTDAKVVSERLIISANTVTETYEPGHSMEWVWLLGFYARKMNVVLPDFAVDLYEKYIAAGYAEGRTPMELSTSNESVDPSRRLWSQTESLKAHLCIVELGPESLRSAARDRAIACAGSMLDDWLGVAHPGGWHDHFNDDGTLISPFMPASSGYHVYFSAAEFARVAHVDIVPKETP